MSNLLKKSTFKIRWGNIIDAKDIHNIELENFEYPWSYEEIKGMFRVPYVKIVVVLHENKIIGYMVYEKYQGNYHILNINVDGDYQGQGVGKQMLKLIKKHHTLLEVRETNLSAQLFFKQCGFKAIKIIKNFYTDCDEDAILFLKEPSEHNS